MRRYDSLDEQLRDLSAKWADLRWALYEALPLWIRLRWASWKVERS